MRRVRHNLEVRAVRLWWTAVLAALSALVVEVAIWFVPQLLRASREPAYSMQFCLVLDIDADTACITVIFLILSTCLLELMIETLCCMSDSVACEHSSLIRLLVQVQYQHKPGGIAQLYLWPGQLPSHQGTLSQRQAYTGQYQV